MGKIIIGLTGGIATGKSTILEKYSQLGAKTISTDKISKRLIEKDEAVISEVAKKFPEAIGNFFLSPTPSVATPLPPLPKGRGIKVSKPSKKTNKGLGVRGEGIDKKILREIIFNDPSRKQDLEAILHPKIKKEVEKQIKDYLLSPPTPYPSPLVIEVPLLFESGFNKLVDKTICTVCSKEIQLDRLKNRGIEKDLAEKIIATQLPQEKLITLCDEVINTD